MLAYSKEFIDILDKVFGIIFVVGVVIGFAVLAISSTKGLLILLKDLKSLKNNDYISIIGKVIKFKSNREPELGVQINDHPIVMILDTGEEVELVLNDFVTAGATYKFNYLKNSKIAEVVEEIK